MDDGQFDKYLRERYEHQIGWYDRKAIVNSRIYYVLQWLVIILSAVTPLLVALTLVDKITGSPSWAVVAVASLVAIGTTATKTFKFEENWINYRTTCETLRKELHFYDAGIGPYQQSEDKRSLFVERVESLISRENTLWVVTHEREEHGRPESPKAR